MTPAPPPRPELAVTETLRLRLEPLFAHHAHELFAGLSDPEIYVFQDDGPPASEAALAKRYRSLEARCSPDGSEAWLNWALFARELNAYVGSVQATVRDEGEAEIAYSLFVPAWGRGFASEAVAAMLEVLRTEFASRRFVAHVDPRNRRSVALLERLDFVTGTRAASNPAQPEPDLVYRRKA